MSCVYHFCFMRNIDSSKAERMRHHIAACRAGTQTVEQYCREHGIDKAVYYYWHKRLQKQHGPSGFIPLNIRDAGSTDTELRFPNGVSIVFNGPVSAVMLKELICCI